MQAYENFISYRRSESSLQVKNLFDELRRRGYPTFCDVYSLSSGDFDEDTLTAIDLCANFILVLGETSLDRCTSPEDWLYREIARAIHGKKNIVLVFVGPASFPDTLPPELDLLRRMNGIPYEIVYFDSFVTRLVSQFLGSAQDAPGARPEDFILEGTTLVRYLGSVRTVQVPSAVTRIGEAAFKDHTELAEVRLPENLTDVAARAFERCISLSYLVLPRSVRTLGGRAFYRCYNLGYVELDDDLEVVGAETFGFCDSLRRIQLNSGLREIESTAFDSCTKLAEISVAGDNSAYQSREGMLLTRDGSTLVRCPEGTAREVVVLPQTVRHIAQSGFSGCVNLTDVVLPQGLLTIGAHAFRNCTRLSGLTLSESVVDVDATALDGWVAHQRITIPETVDAATAARLATVGQTGPDAPASASLGEFVMVKTTFESQEEAERMARLLLDRHLVASGQIGSLRSLYWWEGAKQAEDEIELTCFTRAALYAEVESCITAHHSYEVCQVVSIPITGTTRSFGDWIAQYAHGGERGDPE